MSIKNLKHLRSLLTRKNKFKIIYITILVLFVSLFEIISIGSLFPFLTALTQPEKIFELRIIGNIFAYLNISNINIATMILTIFFCSVVLITGILRLLLLFAQTRLSKNLGIELGDKVISKIYYQNLSWHHLFNSSETISSATNKIDSVVMGIIFNLITFGSSLIILLGILAVLFFINPWISTITIIFFGLTYSFISISVKKRINKYGEDINKSDNARIKTIQEALGGIRDIILHSFQKLYIKEFSIQNSKFRNAIANVQFLSNFPKTIIESIGITFIGFLAYYLTVKNGNITDFLPIMGTLGLAAQRLLPMAQALYSSFTLALGGLSNMMSIKEILDLNVVNNDNNTINKENQFTFKSNIKLENVFYSYDGSESVLEDINIHIEKNQKIGIIGNTGSGKSTLVDIVMGLLEPQNGNILIDQKPLDYKNKKKWQSMISHVPQIIYLTDSTILQNIAFGVEHTKIDLEKVYSCLKIVNLYNFIKSIPNGIDSIIGENGVKLSGGQRQRVGIARALYFDREILVMDEATNALDIKNEKEILKRIFEYKKRTVIIISHRKETLENCDKFYFINNKSIE